MTKLLRFPSSPSAVRHAAVDALLKQSASGAAATGACSWSIPLGADGLPPAVATLDGEWLSLQVPSGPLPAPPAAWDVLQRNSGLTGMAKVVANGKPCGFSLQAEMPVDGEGHARGIEDTLRGFAQALGHHETRQQDLEEPMDPMALCQAAGWPFQKKEGGALSVDLEVDAVLYRARIEPDGAGIRITAGLASAGELSEASRTATGNVLLAAGAAVRMARPAAGPLQHRDSPGVCFEVRLSAGAPAAWLDHALSALSVACKLCGAEISALEETEVAERYLELRDHSAAVLVQPGSLPGQGGA